MAKIITGINLNNDNSSHKVSYEPVKMCPCCKTVLDPVNIAGAIYFDNTTFYFSAFEFCPACKSTFISKYQLSGYISKNNETHKICSSNSSYMIANTLLSCEPNKFSKYTFDSKITKLSPQFDKIYNQALAAEVAELDEIAGLGYRKAMEFLIKDFAIHKNPESIDEIKKQPLAQCIRNYISSEEIKLLAERCAWIGNDEAHYIRVQEDRDVSDMKAFIQAMVYFIGMILITEDAATMTSKK